LLFADDVVLLSSTELGIQRALNDFALAAACVIAEMKIRTTKPVILNFSRNPDQCSLQVCGVSLNQVKFN